MSNQDDGSLSWSQEDRGPEFRSYLIVMLVLAILAISLRLWSRSLAVSRVSTRTRFWWDDWTALAAVPLVIAQYSILFRMLSLGLGRHMSTLPPENVSQSIVLIYAVYFVYDTGLFLTKESALLFFSRVFTKNANKTWFNYCIYAVHALNVSWLLGIIFGTILMCNPVAKNYIPDLPGKCGDTGALWVGSAIPSVVIDLIILLLPLPKIWGLQMNLARKAGITLIFILGYCIIIVSLGRLITVIKSAEALNEDLTYAGIPALYWLCSESPITLISICLPAMLPLGRHLAANFFSPLFSELSNVVSSKKSDSRLRSENGDFSQSGGGRAIRLSSFKGASGRHTSEFAEQTSVHSTGSSRKILVVPPGQDFYEARVQGGEYHGHMNSSVPDQSIVIGKTVEVNRGGTRSSK